MVIVALPPAGIVPRFPVTVVIPVEESNVSVASTRAGFCGSCQRETVWVGSFW